MQINSDSYMQRFIKNGEKNYTFNDYVYHQWWLL